MPTPPLSVPPSLLLLGAGWLGHALAESLAADGRRVTTVRHSSHTAVAGGTAVAFDLAELGRIDARPVELPPALRGHDVVIAALVPTDGGGDDDQDVRPAAAAAAAVRIAIESGARVLCWVSSTAVYGYEHGEEVTEASPRHGHGPAVAALREAEDVILSAASAALRVGVVRVADLYGPGRDPAPRYRHVPAPGGRSAQWQNFAWRDDVVAAIRLWTSHAMSDGSGATLPSVMNVADGTPLTMSECVRLVAQADGRRLDLSPDAADASRTNQRIRVDALRALGWVPAVPNLRVGLLRLGYARLALDAQPYGPQTAEVRAFLRALAALDADEHARVLERWKHHSGTTAFSRADRVLAETMVRVNREVERDSAAGPLLQMMRVDSGADDGASLDPIAEPALAALMAIVLRDVLPQVTYDTLIASMASIVPRTDAT